MLRTAGPSTRALVGRQTRHASTSALSSPTPAPTIPPMSNIGRKKLVILGSGWAGYNVARHVDKKLYDVTVVSPVPFFSFTPFLASTSVGTLEFRCATEPVRGIKGLRYAQGWADAIDFDRREITIESAVMPAHAELAALAKLEEGVPAGPSPTSSLASTSSEGAPSSAYHPHPASPTSGSSSSSVTSWLPSPGRLFDTTPQALQPSRGMSTAAEAWHGQESGIPPRFYKMTYDKLVIACGCYSASFGIPGVAKYAHFLKDIRDARKIRLRLLECLEQASEPGCSPELRRALLSFKVVGGGPTGVEWAAELHDFIHKDVYRLYPHLRDQVSITLYDVAPGILINFDESLRAYAEKKFHRNGVSIKGNSRITAVGEDWIEVDGKERHPYGLLVWSTGLAPNPFIDSLPVRKHERSKAIKVDQWQRVVDTEGKRLKGVFAIGDNATPKDGLPLPATAQVANQQAYWLAKTLNRHAKSAKTIEEQKPFEWKNMGSMVYIGNQRAMVDRSDKEVTGPKSRLAGVAAWFIWRSYYTYATMGLRNRILVPLYWTLAGLLGRDITRF